MRKTNISFNPRRLKNEIINRVRNPYIIITIIAVVILSYLIILPLFEMVMNTFRLTQQDVRRVPSASAGDFSFYYWARLLFSQASSALLWQPLLNSLFISLTVSIYSVTLGSMIAWLLVRSDLPGKKFFSLAVIIPYMLPSWCKSMAWLTVFKNARIGGRIGFLASLGIDTPNWLAYGPLPIIIVLTIHYYAYAYLLVSAALSSLNSEVEEMGEIAGATKGQILGRITLPLVLPAILSSFILTFSKTMGTFGVPAFLGMKVNYYTISTTLYSTIRQRQTATGFAIAVILILISALFIYINQKAIGSRKSYALIGGKGGRKNPLPLGKAKKPIVVFLILFIGIVVIGPIIILTIDTFMLKPGNYSFSNFSLHYWIGASDQTIYEGESGILVNPRFLRTLFNTLALVGVTSLIASFCGQIVGYIISRGRGKISGKFLEQLVFIPYLIPSIAFGALYLSMFAMPRLFIPSLYGTFALLVLVCVVKNLPFSCRAGISTMMQVSVELEEAAAIPGASFLRRFTRIVFPLSRSGFISGFILIFISVMKELDLIIILITPQLATLPYMAFQYSNENMFPYSNAIAVLMFLIVLVTYLITYLSGKADITRSMGA
ncbi:ABC transporter permease [Breznakiella homolactica]|uniref:Iron ABC transporter permease n=1 Tax=Breznakiella homolactica TaxID=2798577 RepID=A0A7T7XLR1_9SPIR|nr:iron ABC transporter permease [Breznakiella homolactica]QQO08542.1 iron ABC transporter permease [Breznakiella homolactica]